MRREGRREGEKAGPVGLYRDNNNNILEEVLFECGLWSITVLGEYRRMPCRSGIKSLSYVATSGLRKRIN